ncbi:MAG: SpoIIE family protein phosphatase [Thermoanaerobaculia bacterium]
MRERFALRVVGSVLLLVGPVTVAAGQVPEPAEITVGEVASSPFGISFDRPWRFHHGDDLRWADPTLDDSGWELVVPQMPPGKLPRDGWTGVGWFRRHLLVREGLWGRPLDMALVASGIAEVYLDGELLYRTGDLVGGEAPEVTAPVRGPRKFVFSARTDHLLAVRYTYAALRESQPPGGEIGFTVSLGEMEATWAKSAIQRTRTMFGVVITLLVFVALLHFALYFFYRKARANLFYALWMVSFTIIMFRDFIYGQPTRPPWAEPLNRFLSPSPVIAILLGLFTYYAVKDSLFPRTWIAFTAAAAVLIPLFFLIPEQLTNWLWILYLAAMLGEIVRVERKGRAEKQRRVTTFLAGMGVFTVFAALQALINFGVIPPIAGFRAVYPFGVLASILTMSLSLARSFALTSLHLDRRLIEVQALSGQLLEQERAAHANDLRARLLEAENARKTKELEEGRALQLSMLPTGLPEVEGLDVAMAMSTASEVGGDYYDFRVDPDGSLVIAIGDATGHGVAAGTMVTAVKALFAAFEGQRSLVTMLAECDRVLRGMHLRHVQMCLAVARVTPRSVAVSSAAMPPVLIHRAVTGRVEELGSGGLPLGGRLSPTYPECHAPLSPGDTLLLATDGFAEALDPDGNALGFERAAETLRDAANAPAREVIDRLMVTVAAWRRSREQSDDITFVVVRVGVSDRETPSAMTR